MIYDATTSLYDANNGATQSMYSLDHLQRVIVRTGTPLTLNLPDTSNLPLKSRLYLVFVSGDTNAQVTFAAAATDALNLQAAGSATFVVTLGAIPVVYLMACTNQHWYIGSIPSQTSPGNVAITAGTGITIGGSYPAYTVTNSAPDQTVAITSGGGCTVTGTYPNFVVSVP